MAANNISYPHPVLGNGDDFSIGEISPTVEYEISAETVHLSVFNLISGHEEIEKLIVDGDAVWHLRVQCARTYMRKNFQTHDNKFEVRLPGEDYEGVVQVYISIVAKNDIPNFKPAHLHDDYEDEEFQISAGEVIGVGPKFRFLVDKVYDPLKAPVSSIVRITEGENKDGPFTLSMEDEYIVVRLSKSDWQEYAGIRDRTPTIVHSAVVLPALSEAIRRIHEHTDTLWGGRLLNMLESKNIDPETPLMAAQQILACPVTRTFNEVNTTLDRREI